MKVEEREKTTTTLKSFGPDDVASLSFVHGADVSPDGRRVVYAATRIDEETEKVSLWLVSSDGGDPKPLTLGDMDHSAVWSPDGKQIAFLSTRSGKPQIHLISPDGGEARQLTSLEQGVAGPPAWSPDSARIAFTATGAEKRDPAKAYRVTRNVYRMDAAGYVADVIQDVFVVDVEGGEPKQLTSDDVMNTNPQWFPDGTKLLYATSFEPGADAPFATLRTVDLDGNVADVTSDGAVAAAGITPDGRVLAVMGYAGISKPIGSKSDVWVIEPDGTRTNRTEGLAVGVGGGLQPDMPSPIAWGGSARIHCTAESNHALVPVQEGGTLSVYRVALSGAESWEPVLTGDRACYLLGVAGNRLLYATATLVDPLDLYLGDTQLTSLNDDVLVEFDRPTVEHLEFTSVDGTSVEGWFVAPPGEPPFPTILYIHGGPHFAWGHTFHLDFNMLCGAGFGVLLVNHRASTGYGDAFSTAIKGDWGNLDYQDLMAGVDHAIELGLADADRLGVCGISGGGNLSCWIVGQTDRFRAAVPENPVTNFVSQYGTMDIGPWFCVEELGGHPHEIPDVYAKCSPITYAHRCTTPTLLVQGEFDLRCPAGQSEEFYAVLRQNGCTVEMLRLPNSPHAGSVAGPVPLRQAQNDALLGWMKRFVLGEDV